MSALEDLPSSPSHYPEGTLAYYKSQYEQVEAELADFQASSKELEAELEKDIEAADKRERQLREKLEALGFEVEEWKTKYKQAKTEANSAQNTLQKEITTLRDTSRTLQLKLRDIEVSNDDFERQARNTSSSLEDLESKYNVAIERGVMAEEEIRRGEQERESLRIETQRLRDELSDLKIEAEIRQDKLRHAEAAVERQHKRKLSPIAPDFARPQSALSELSPTTSTSSPTIATPPTKSASSIVSETLTPPSPPASEKSNPTTTTPALPVPKSRLSITDTNTTPRPTYMSRPTAHSRKPSMPVNTDRAPQSTRRSNMTRSDYSSRTQGLPTSGSLHHLHGLMNKMHLLEQRVHSARSKLPAPTSTPPQASPRSGSSLGQSYIPATVTMRSNKKRAGGSNVSSLHNPGTDRPPSRLSSAYTTGIERPSSRLSTNLPHPSPTRDSNPSSRPPSRDALPNNRPTSRASLASRQSISHLPSASIPCRPESRQSISGTRTPLSHYTTTTTNTHSESRRPRSSIGGSYSAMHSGHGSSASVSRIATSSYGSRFQHSPPTAIHDEEITEVLTPTPSRRTTFGNEGPGPGAGSGIPVMGGNNAGERTKRVGAGGSVGLGMVGRRISAGVSGGGGGDMGPPPPSLERRGGKKLSGVGESY